MFENKLKMSDLGYIIVNDKMETNIPGVFAAGSGRPAFQAGHYLCGDGRSSYSSDAIPKKRIKLEVEKRERRTPTESVKGVLL